MRNYKKNPTFPSPAGHVAGKVRVAAGKAAGVADRVRASRSYEESRKEPKNYLLPSTHSLRRNISCHRKKKTCDGHTHTHTDRTQISRLCGEKREMTENERAFWSGKMEKMVRGGRSPNAQREMRKKKMTRWF